MSKDSGEYKMTMKNGFKRELKEKLIIN